MVNNINVYDQVAPVYAEYASKRKEYINSIDQLVIDSLNSNMRLLDIGAGDGIRLSKILDITKIKNAMAIEPSLEMAKLCKLNADVEVKQSLIENIDIADMGTFDAITALWNVLGHIPSNSRVKSLKLMAKLLSPDGIIMLDVNNRHNAASYGKLKIFWRKVIDTINFKESRGDSYYNWHIGKLKIPSYGHLFIYSELMNLFNQANLIVEDFIAVNYINGNLSNNKTQGQLFFRLRIKRD